MSKYTVRHFTNSNIRTVDAEVTSKKEAKEEMRRYTSFDENGGVSKLYSDCGDIIAYRDWNKKRITWI